MNNDEKHIVVSKGGYEILLILRIKNWTTFLNDVIHEAKKRYYDDLDVSNDHSLQESICDSLAIAGYEYEVIAYDAQEVIL